MLPVKVNGALFRHVATLKVNGSSWQNIAEHVNLPVEELQQLPWRFKQQWQEYTAYAQQLDDLELLTQLKAGLRTDFIKTDDIRLRVQISNSLLRIAQSHQPKTTKIKEEKSSKAKRPKAKPPDPVTPSIPPILVEAANTATPVLHAGVADTGRAALPSCDSKPEPECETSPSLVQVKTAPFDSHHLLNPKALMPVGDNEETTAEAPIEMTDEEFNELEEQLIFADMLKAKLQDRPELYKKVMNIANLDPDGEFAAERAREEQATAATPPKQVGGFSTVMCVLALVCSLIFAASNAFAFTPSEPETFATDFLSLNPEGVTDNSLECEPKVFAPAPASDRGSQPGLLSVTPSGFKTPLLKSTVPRVAPD